jgi:hypothetical protein
MPRTTPKKPVAKRAAFPLPALKKGEVYAGILLKDGQPTHHLILLPGDDHKPWADAVAWAKKKGGILPTRKEQALLFANAADKFEQRWYWSSEEYAGNADCAWIQRFSNGNQIIIHKSLDYRCRAVRRVAI